MDIRWSLDRIVFGVALIGLLTATHLAVQQARDFEAGCTGTSLVRTVGQAAGGGSGCGTVVESAAGTFLGVSNIVWGFLFYGSLALVSLARGALGWRRRILGRLRELVVTIGFGYTGFLIYYQAAVLDAFCALCLISAVLVTVLFGATAVDVWLAPGRAPEFRRGPREGDPSWYAAVAAVAVLLAAADVIFLGGGVGAAALSAQAAPFSSARAVRLVTESGTKARGCGLTRN